MTVFRGQRFDVTGRARHLINRLHHRFVVVRHREIVLRLRDIQAGVQPAAVENGQRQPGGHAHLLRGSTEQIAEVEGILL